MEIKELHEELQEAYSNENLNRITAKLILLYKNRDFFAIRTLAKKVSGFVPMDGETDAKSFSRLMMLYHPDKGDRTRNEIKKLFEKDDFENLYKYSHILAIADLDRITINSIGEDIDYHPEYVWDEHVADGFTYSDSMGEFSSRDMDEDEDSQHDFEKSFYNVVRIREYGNLNVKIPPYYFEDLEDFELSYSELESLDGLEYCKHVKTLDISNNKLTDLSQLWVLKHLEELYLSNNQLAYIDALSNLSKLRILDLSGNQVEDISPLFKLEELRLLKLMDNPVPDDQIDFIRQKGVIVMKESI